MANGGFTLTLNKGDERKMARILAALPKAERTPAVRSAFNRAMTPMVKEARKNIDANNPQNEFSTGLLKKHIIKAAYPSKLYTKAGGKRGKGFHGSILHWVDRGTTYRHKKNGQSTGKMYSGRSGYTVGWKFNNVRKKRVYFAHGKPGAWTAAWNASKEKVGRILAEGLDKAIKQIFNK